MNKVLKFVCAFAVIFAVEALLFASFASAAATVTDPASAEPAVSTSYILFTGNHAEILNGVAYHTFRIPAVVRTNAGTLLAFAEGRANSKVDWGNINVLYKRSINNGQTAEDWSLLIQAASIGLDTGGNPTPVVDRQTGTIWLFMSWNSANTSQKGMLNPDSHLPTKPVSQWGMDGSSNPTDMTETLTPKTHADGGVWAWDAVGPGAGLYTSDGIIIIPVQFRNIYYSTDHGETWQVQRFPESTGEATIDDGSLYRNDRPNTTNWSAAQRRCISRGSLDGGFSAYEPDDKLLDPMNQASVLLYNNAEPDAPTRMIFLNSASTVTRTKMRFRISYDNAKTWPMSRPLSDLPLPPGSGTESSYSSMVKTADNRVGAMWKPTWTSRIMMYLLLGFYGIGKVNLGWLLRGCAC